MPSPVRSVATLISNPRAPALEPSLLQRAQALVEAWRSPGADPVTLDILDPGIAVDLAVALPDAGAGLQQALRVELAGAPVDVVVQPLAHRRKRLFLADMDSTIIGQECIDELADVVGIKAHVAAITERAMRGEIEFEPALRERVGLLRGLDVSVIGRVIAERITLTPGARALVQTLRRDGAQTMLVSGGFTLFTGEIAARVGFHENRANILEIENGKLAGLVREPILGREAKRNTLMALRAAFGIAAEAVMAVGDGANDLSMLAEAGLGVAFRAKPAVAAAAHARIDHGDLTALLYMQGYRRAEFAE